MWPLGDGQREKGGATPNLEPLPKDLFQLDSLREQNAAKLCAQTYAFLTCSAISGLQPPANLKRAPEGINYPREIAILFCIAYTAAPYPLPRLPSCPGQDVCQQNDIFSTYYKLKEAFSPQGSKKWLPDHFLSAALGRKSSFVSRRIRGVSYFGPFTGNLGRLAPCCPCRRLDIQDRDCSIPCRHALAKRKIRTSTPIRKFKSRRTPLYLPAPCLPWADTFSSPRSHRIHCQAEALAQAGLWDRLSICQQQYFPRFSSSSFWPFW